MRVVDAACGLGGTVLAATFGTVARLRPADKPLHPRGRQHTGTLTRSGTGAGWGVPWLDGAGSERVLVRFSRAMGLPEPWPDILGLTIRVQADDWYADLLLATTGTGTPGRFTLLPRRDAATDYGSLMPYGTPTGPVMFRARCESDDGPLTLYAAPPTGDWQPFGTIALDAAEPSDPTISFDPLLHPVPGLEIYPWTRRLREGAYAASRSARA